MVGAIQCVKEYTTVRISEVEVRLLEEVDERVARVVHINMGVVHVASPHGECMHNDKHLSIMDQVVDLSRVGLVRINELEALALVLHEDDVDSKVRGVGVKVLEEGGVGEDDHGSGGSTVH